MIAGTECSYRGAWGSSGSGSGSGSGLGSGIIGSGSMTSDSTTLMVNDYWAFYSIAFCRILSTKISYFPTALGCRGSLIVSEFVSDEYFKKPGS